MEKALWHINILLMASTSLKDYQNKFIILFPIHMILCRKFMIVGPRCKSRTLISCFVSNILYSILQHFTRFLFQNRIKFGTKVVKTPSKSLMIWTDALSNKQVNTNEIDRKKILDFSCQRLNRVVFGLLSIHLYHILPKNREN